MGNSKNLEPGKFILGNGISGLIWKFYNPEFEAIGPRVAPNLDQFSRSSMIWLHDCVETRRLLEDLGWENPHSLVRQAKIGYYDSGVIRDKLTPALQASIINQKMLPVRYKWGDKSLAPPGVESRLSLSGFLDGTNYMNVLSVEHAEILNRLRLKTECTETFAVAITDTHIGFSNNPKDDSGAIWNPYDQIISTVPAPIFFRLWKNGHPDFEVPDLESHPVSFAVTTVRPAEYEGPYEMVYYDESQVWSRISYLNGQYCIEFTGEMTKEEFCDVWPDLAEGLTDFWTLPGGRIVSKKMPELPNIIFSGRFAKWNHKLTTEHVVEQAISYNGVTRKKEALG